MGVQVCVIDAADDGDRSNAWLTAGTSALIDKTNPSTSSSGRSPSSCGVASSRRLRRGTLRRLGDDARSDDERRPERLELFATLTDREKVVLAELIEGHCAEDIAKGAFVSISTVRSQIKSILQKLGVNSQLAAVAMARRAGWSLENPPGTPPEPSNSRRRRVS